jgi:hypothetical protein
MMEPNDAQLVEQIINKIGAAKFDIARLSAGRAGNPALSEVRKALDQAALATANLKQALADA